MKLKLFIPFIFLSLSLFSVDKPNIVWVVSEDNSASWLKLYSKTGVEMPAIEKLAKNGLVFNNAFSCAPVCSVARSTIISGCYGPRVGTQYHRNQQYAKMPDGLKLFPYYLKQVGYYTSNCHKEDYNYNPKEKEGVWDESSRKASYKKRKPGQPFFHVQNFTTTHESSLHFQDMKKKTTDNPADMRVFKYHPDTETFRYTYAYYRDRHRLVDQQISKFLKGLEKDDLLDDTFIFYYGDHGGVLPRGKGYAYNNGLQVPMVVYVPKNWQHLSPASRGSRVDGFVQFVDLAPTVLELAGLKSDLGFDGKAFLGKEVKLDELNKRNTSYGYADRFDEKYDMVRTVRKGDFHYMRNYQRFNYDGLYNRYRYRMLAYKEWQKMFDEGKLTKEQSQFFEERPVECLYDLSNDPDEVNNLAKDPQYSAIVKEMRGLLTGQVKDLADLSFIPEPIMIREGVENFVEYGQKNKQRIAKLSQISDLSLRAFPEIKKDLTATLNSSDALERYWGLIVCSNFGNQAIGLYDKAKKMLENDSDLFVKTRALEFLALNNQIVPGNYIKNLIEMAKDENDLGLILNTVVLLRDGKHKYKFDLNYLLTEKRWSGLSLKSPTGRRLEYLIGYTGKTK
ncbi:MAG: sulfatase [Lentisphaeraceae bacterium]|nr:sulfatase [Lentisphaeraceae bacterium]